MANAELDVARSRITWMNSERGKTPMSFRQEGGRFLFGGGFAAV